MTGKEFLKSKQVKNIVLGISNQIGIVDLATLLELYHTQQLAINGVVVPQGTLCQHDRKVTNRICDDCGSVITYVPDEDLA